MIIWYRGLAMRKRFRLLAATALLGMLVSSAPAPRADARGEDVCPEPNNEFQVACFLGRDSDAVGFISTPGDVDGYRIEVLDFDVKLELNVERPLPYKVELRDWNDVLLDESMEGQIRGTFGPPGTYYLFVSSPTGQFSDSMPYRIERRLSYPRAIPEVLYVSELRGGGRPDYINVPGQTSHEDEDATYRLEKGRLVIAMKRAGTRDEPEAAYLYEAIPSHTPGLELADFTLSMDVFVKGANEAGYQITFRVVDDLNQYSLDVDVGSQEALLSKLIDGERTRITDWVAAPTVGDGKANRTVIRCVGPEIVVYLNGREVIRARDGTYAKGTDFGYGAVTWSAPVTVNFDNMLITTPTYR